MAAVKVEEAVLALAEAAEQSNRSRFQLVASEAAAAAKYHCLELEAAEACLQADQKVRGLELELDAAKSREAQAWDQVQSNAQDQMAAVATLTRDRNAALEDLSQVKLALEQEKARAQAKAETSGQLEEEQSETLRRLQTQLAESQRQFAAENQRQFTEYSEALAKATEYKDGAAGRCKELEATCADLESRCGELEEEITGLRAAKAEAEDRARVAAEKLEALDKVHEDQEGLWFRRCFAVAERAAWFKRRLAETGVNKAESEAKAQGLEKQVEDLKERLHRSQRVGASALASLDRNMLDLARDLAAACIRFAPSSTLPSLASTVHSEAAEAGLTGGEDTDVDSLTRDLEVLERDLGPHLTDLLQVESYPDPKDPEAGPVQSLSFVACCAQALLKQLDEESQCKDSICDSLSRSLDQVREQQEMAAARGLAKGMTQSLVKEAVGRVSGTPVDEEEDDDDDDASSTESPLLIPIMQTRMHERRIAQNEAQMAAKAAQVESQEIQLLREKLEQRDARISSLEKVQDEDRTHELEVRLAFPLPLKLSVFVYQA